MVTKQIEDMAGEVTRNSKQPRFNATDRSKMFWSMYRWVKEAYQVEPPYVPNSGKRDKWLREYVRGEPFLHGVLASVVSVDKNRGWTLLGAEHLVRKYVNRLHKLHAAPDQRGWRPFTGFLSHSYHCADIGAVAEIEWSAVDVITGFNAEVNSLYSVDPTHCRLTGDIEYPLAYTGDDLLKLDPQEWNTNAYFRMVDNINTDATFNGLGICAVSRALELAKILTALYEHDAEQLLSKAPRGLLLLNGISEEQWESTLQARVETMSDLEKKYYTGVQVFAGNGLEKVSAELVSLSRIPDGLDHVEFTNLVMNLYALAFKYDPREFWPVSGGQLGTATETETQHKKATGKGGMDFILTYQENLQDLLPPTVEFEFEARDIDGEIKDESLTSAIVKNIVDLGAAGYIDEEQAKIMLAEAEIIHKEWANSPHQMTTDQEDNPEGGHAGEHDLFDAKTQTLSFLNGPQGKDSLAFLKQQRSPILDFLKKRNSKLVHQVNDQPRLEDLIEVDREAIARSLFHFPDQRIVKYVERDGIGQYMPIQIKRKARVFYSFKERKNITDHDGSMIAIFIPKEVAERLRKIADGLGLPKDTLQELAENMHVTLAFFPDNDFKDPIQLSKAEVVTQIAMSKVPLLEGNVQGYGVFNGGKEGPVLYASVDIPGLNELRAALCENLGPVGLTYAQDHGFTPHITLAYLGGAYELPEGFQVPDIPISIKEIAIVSGKKRTIVPLPMYGPDFSREGKGKGNWGHAGRPNLVGGSAPGPTVINNVDVSEYVVENTDALQVTRVGTKLEKKVQRAWVTMEDDIVDVKDYGHQDFASRILNMDGSGLSKEDKDYLWDKGIQSPNSEHEAIFSGLIRVHIMGTEITISTAKMNRSTLHRVQRLITEEKISTKPNQYVVWSGLKFTSPSSIDIGTVSTGEAYSIEEFLQKDDVQYNGTENAIVLRTLKTLP